MSNTSDKSKRIKILLGIVLGSQVVSSTYSTQKIAEFFEYHKTLGWDYGAIGLPHVYFPFAWLDWFNKCKDISNVDWVFKTYGLDIAYYSFLGSMLIGMLVMMRKGPRVYEEHGTAHWATDDDLYEYGHDQDTRTFKDKLLGVPIPTNDNYLFSGEGVFLGIWNKTKYLRDNAKTHVLLLAPTRSGKGVGHIVPTLLDWKGSIVVADPKGENWDLTSGYRKYKLKNKVLQFKPMHAESCKYNPFTEIRITTAKEMGDLQLITKILVDQTGKGFETGDTHWIESADILLQGVTLHLLYQKRFHNVDQNGNPLPGTIATLSDVLDFLYDGQDGSTISHENDEKSKQSPFPPPKEVEKKTESGKTIKVLDVKSQVIQSVFGTDNEEEEYIDGDDDYATDEEREAYQKLGSSFTWEDAYKKGEELLKEQEKKNKTMSGNGAAYKNAPQKADLNEIVSEFADEEIEGLEGLQKKLAYVIHEAQYLPREHLSTGYKHAPDDDERLFERLYPDKKSRRGTHPFVRQIFQSMSEKPDKEFGSILSTLDKTLAIYRNPILVHNISSSDFVMKDLMDCEQPISLYLVFGSGEIQVIKPLLRVVIELMWRLNVEELFKHRYRLLMLLDEFPAFGKLEGIEKSLGFTAGYGIKLFIIAQDMNQINALYTSDNYIVSNCQVQIYHGPSDNNSAKYISDKLGKKTIKVTSESRNSNILPMPNSYNDSLIGRELMTPDEVYRLDPNKLIVFCKGCSPILADKIKYYSNPDFKDKVKIKSPGHSDTVFRSDRRWNWHEYKLLNLPFIEEIEYIKLLEGKRDEILSNLLWAIQKRQADLQYEIDFDTLLLEEDEEMEKNNG